MQHLNFYLLTDCGRLVCGSNSSQARLHCSFSCYGSKDPGSPEDSHCLKYEQIRSLSLKKARRRGQRLDELAMDDKISVDVTAPATTWQEQFPSHQMDGPDGDHIPAQHQTECHASQAGKPAHNRDQYNSTHRDGPRVKSSKPSPSTKRADVNRRNRIGEPESTHSRIMNTMSDIGGFMFGTGSRQQQRHTYLGDGSSDLGSRYENEMANLEERFNKTLEHKLRGLQASFDQVTHDKDKAIHELRVKLQESEVENNRIQAEYDAFICKQQEASFKRMQSARWRPLEESKVTNDLDRLKRDMRSWAKTTSVTELSPLESLETTESTALMQALDQVVLFENGQLPEVLRNAKRSPMILLSALLTHNVYKNYFQNPFYFLSGTPAHLVIGEKENSLESIYREAKLTNKKDAHVWRSDTLRLLMPPERYDTSEAEKQMQLRTKDLIARLADQHALNFLSGPARHLINSETNTDFTTQLKTIFKQGADISYSLWTRRSDMQCRTLRDLTPLTFDSDSPKFTLDSLVNHDEEEEGLKGSKVTVLMHPLLEVYGNDEAEDYDKSRVWAAGVVWLDNREAAHNVASQISSSKA